MTLMIDHTTDSKNKTVGALLAAAMASSAFAAAAVGYAPTANATCASFFGIGNSASCVSNLTSIAIAIGAGATADASGLFGAAIAVGTDSSAGNAVAGALNFSTAFGEHAVALGGGLASLAVTVGDNSETAAGMLSGIPEFGNSAINLGNSSQGTTNSVTANGIISNAVNGLGNAMTLNATGILTHVGTLGGDHSVNHTDPNTLTIASMGIHAFGSNNDVTVGGPLAVAISVFQTGATVTQTTPGVNLNGLSNSGAAAPKGAAARTVKKPAVAKKAASKKASAATSSRRDK